MFYVKNVPGWERFVRIISGVVGAVLSIVFLKGLLGVIGAVVAAGITVSGISCCWACSLSHISFSTLLSSLACSTGR